MIYDVDKSKVVDILNKQLSNFWDGMYQRHLVDGCIQEALDKCLFSFQSISLTRCNDGVKITFSPYDTVQWAVFLYYLSNILFKRNYIREATVVYYLNKVMHSVEWFYAINLPVHFFAEHPHNSILGKAVYGDYFFCFHGTTVGANYRADGSAVYPKLGNNVFMCANSSVLGHSNIGDNVIISANICIKDTDVPNNSIVFGDTGGGISIRTLNAEQIKSRTSGFWRWSI